MILCRDIMCNYLQFPYKFPFDTFLQDMIQISSNTTTWFWSGQLVGGSRAQSSYSHQLTELSQCRCLWDWIIPTDMPHLQQGRKEGRYYWSKEKEEFNKIYSRYKNKLFLKCWSGYFPTLPFPNTPWSQDYAKPRKGALPWARGICLKQHLFLHTVS